MMDIAKQQGCCSIELGAVVKSLKSEKVGNLLLLLAALIWGCAFVAQSEGTKYVGAFTFLCSRSFIGAVVLLPVAFMRKNEETSDVRSLVRGGVLCGLALMVASAFQQLGIAYTGAGKAGFITTLYIVLVPVVGLFLKKKIGINVWISVGLAIVGMYLLCVSGSVGIERGDILLLMCAVFFTVHILVIDYYAPKVDCVKMSCIQFFVCGILSAVAMFVFEEPDMGDVLAAWKPILYAGAMSSGVAFTLQIIGQKYTKPAVATVIMSLESVFAVLAGVVILHETFTGREVWGCVLIFAATIIAQLPEKRKADEDEKEIV